MTTRELERFPVHRSRIPAQLINSEFVAYEHGLESVNSKIDHDRDLALFGSGHIMKLASGTSKDMAILLNLFGRPNHGAYHRARFVGLTATFILLTIASGQPAETSAKPSPSGTTARTCSEDGRNTAPPGLSQHPTLLSKYVKRPQCHVAGVDYHVGPPSGTNFKDPTIAVWRGPFSYDPARHLIRCDNGTNQTIGGYDFSLHGGIGMFDASCTNLTIENSKFGVGTNCIMPINQSAEASGITVRQNLIDGGGYVASCSHDPVGESVLLGGGGEKVVEYNWIRNAAQHFISLTGRGGSARIRFNLVERCGFFQGNHCNGIQFVGGSWMRPTLSHNTFVSEQPDVGGTLHSVQSARFVAGSNSAITGSDYGLISLDDTYAASLGAGMSITSPFLPSGTKIESVSNTGGPCCSGPRSRPVVTRLVLTRKATKTGNSSFDVPNAYPSGLVNPIQVDAQLGAVIRDAKVNENIVLAVQGPVKTVSYNISLGSDSSSFNIGAFVTNNYIDASGAYGAFYPSDCRHSTHCYGAAFSGNIDMQTGAEIVPRE